MTADAALEVLALVERAHVDAWVDGGWGVDALLGRQTRLHRDLDLVVPVHRLAAARKALTGAGFAVVRDLLPTAVAYGHADGRQVDLHPVSPTPDGGGDQDLSGDPELPADLPFHYGPPVRGRIAGVRVRCVDGETQLRAHGGYVPGAQDRADVAALADHLEVEPPAGDRSGVLRHHRGVPAELDPAIRIVAYDLAWPELAVAEGAAVRQALGAAALRVDHVGSTSVPGLAAKPVVDLQVSVADVLDLGPHRTALAPIGYRYEPYPDPDGVDRYPFFGKPWHRPRSYHVHLARAGSLDELRHLAVRDYLRTHAEEAAAYAAVKRDAAARHQGDRLAYIAAKSPFVEALERRALDWHAGERS